MAAYLGQKIKHLRKNKGLTQFDLEKKTGIKREYLSKIENNELNNPTFSTLLKICDGIGIPITELLSGDDELPVRKEPLIKIFSGKESEEELAEKIEGKEFVAIPIISAEFAASNPKYISQNDIIDYAIISGNFLESQYDQHRYRCVSVETDDLSMYPQIEPKGVVCIDSYQNNAEELDGKIVALKNNDGICSVRYLKSEKKYLLGMPENIKEYVPLIFSANKQNYILGKVIWYQSVKSI